MSSSAIIYCHCGYTQLIPEHKKNSIFNLLTDSSVDFLPVYDFCQLAAHKDPLVRELASKKNLTIIACFPRTIKWLFNFAGFPIEQINLKVLNTRLLTPEQIIADATDNKSLYAKPKAKPEKSGDWIPWFPVIDYDRCINCKQCLNFCLFGVYSLSDDGKILVQNPSNCKTNCPACARACPQSAIIFPKYHSAPINGENVDDIKTLSAKNTNLDKLLSGNIHDLIRKRNIPNTASPDSISDLQKLQNDLDIPQDVLDNLSEKNGFEGHNSD